MSQTLPTKDYLESKSKEILLKAKSLKTNLGTIREKKKEEFEKYERCLEVAKVYSKYGMEKEKNDLVKVAMKHLEKAKELKKEEEKLLVKTKELLKKSRETKYSGDFKTNVEFLVADIRSKINEIGLLKLISITMPVIFFAIMYRRGKK